MNAIKTSMPYVGYWDTRQGGRAENQDSCGFIDTDKGLIAVVCDGMGGGPGGQLASTIAVQKIVEYVVGAPQDMPRTEMVANAIEHGHQAILAKTAETPALRGMGSTATVLLINEQSAILGHVGDSRIYQFRHGKKIFRTADHSMVADLVRNGTLTEEQARLSSQSNIITKALGSKLTNLAEVTERPYEKGDRFMLCTDGIWGAMPEPELIKRVAKTPSLSGAVDGTVLTVDDIGRKNGNHHDNLTIALLETKQDSLLKEKMSKTRGNRIRALEDSINAMWGNVANSKQEAADATLKAAKEKENAAEKAKSEAEQNAKEAKEAADKAKAAADQAKSAADAILKSRNDVIAQLTKIKDMQENAQRKQMRSAVAESLKTLADKDAKHKSVYDDVREKLGNKVASENTDMSKGHYNILIKNLQSIK